MLAQVVETPDTPTTVSRTYLAFAGVKSLSCDPGVVFDVWSTRSCQVVLSVDDSMRKRYARSAKGTTMVLPMSCTAPRSTVTDCGKFWADHRVVTSPSTTRGASFPTCCAVAVTGLPVDSAGVSCATCAAAIKK